MKKKLMVIALCSVLFLSENVSASEEGSGVERIFSDVLTGVVWGVLVNRIYTHYQDMYSLPSKTITNSTSQYIAHRRKLEELRRPVEDNYFYKDILSRAVIERDKEGVRLLLDNERFDSESLNLSLSLVLNFQHREYPCGLVKLLLERGANANYSNFGRAPLSSAVRNGDKESVKILLDHGAKINFLSSGHAPKTALEEAFIMSRKEIIELLLRAGATCPVPRFLGSQHPLIRAANRAFPVFKQVDDEWVNIVRLIYASGFVPPSEDKLCRRADISGKAKMLILDEYRPYAIKRYTEYTDLLYNRAGLSKDIASLFLTFAYGKSEITKSVKQEISYRLARKIRNPLMVKGIVDKLKSQNWRGTQLDPLNDKGFAAEIGGLC